jgi:hypothetical protein
MFATSPHKSGVGMTQNFISLDSPDSVARSSRLAIKTELIGKLAFDDPAVFQHLGLNRVPFAFVDSCTKALKVDEKCDHAQNALRVVTNAAAGKGDEDLEADEDDPEGQGKKVKKKAEEKKMYPHLVCFFCRLQDCVQLTKFYFQTTIFDYIQTFRDSSNHSHAQPNCRFALTSSTVLKADSSHWGFPKASPDFTLLDATSTSRRHDGLNQQQSHLWRDRIGFCEVKPANRQGPKVPIMLGFIFPRGPSSCFLWDC